MYKKGMQPLTGAKGGDAGSQRQPVEAPDSLSSIAYARVLDLISEGEIVGLKDGLKSVFLDETPMMNADGTLNFQGAKIWTRTGSQDQTYIPGFPAVESEIGIGVELKSDQPWTRSINNSQLSGVSIRLAVSGIKQQIPSNGDTVGYYIAYAIDLSTGGGPFVQVLSSAFNGKQNNKYERQHRVNLPKSATGWQVRVRRLTPNANSSIILDTTRIESITEIIDGKFRYPNSALVGSQFDSSQFSSIPSRAFLVRGRIIQVPRNYDPEARTYATSGDGTLNGVWDGSFKPAWTNNPAWIYYDLLLHPRYGLGNRMNASQVNRYDLYNIGRYCDEMVDDGKGGLEPRFTCNVYIQQRKDALRVLQDLAAVFRGITYWGGSIAQVSADLPSDPVYTYTNANVIGGKFAYKSSSKSTRYSTALVSWNDPNDFYRTKVAYHEDQDLIELFGIQQVELTAFGCTSEGQANRAAKWALVTNKLETDSVSFTVGIEGVRCRPGQIIRVADNARAGRRIGGRIRSASSTAVIVDQLGEIRPGDKLTVITPSGVAETRTVKEGFCGIGKEGGQMVGSTNYYAGSTIDFVGEFNITGCVITLTEPFSAAPAPESVWAFENDELSAQRFRVAGVAESGPMEYAITATKYVEGKYAFIDNGTLIQQPPITIIPPSVQPTPQNITVTSDFMLDQGAAVSKMVIAWDKAEHAVAYEVQWKRDNSDWVFAGRTGTTEMDVSGIYAGAYLIRVMAFNPLGVTSSWGYSALTELKGKTTAPPAVSGLRTESKIFGIDVLWGFPAFAQDTNYTELQYNTSPNEVGAIKQGDHSYPTNSARLVGLGPGVRFYFRARLVDKTGNIGPWTDWVVGTSSADASPILDAITGQITETQLGQDLIAKIESAGAIKYDSTKSYLVNDIVWFGDRIYMALSTVPVNTIPPNPTYWKDVGSFAGDIEANAQAIQTTSTNLTNLNGVVTAQGTALTQVQATAGNAQVTAQQALTATATTDGKLSVSLNIKLGIDSNGTYYGAGMGIGIENTPEGIQSQVVFLADRFAVMSAINGTPRAFFAVQGGITYMDTAFIQNGTVSFLKVGDDVQSTNYIEGQTGWRLAKNGNLEFNGPVAGGGRLTMTNRAIKVYDENGVKRVQLGDLSA